MSEPPPSLRRRKFWLRTLAGKAVAVFGVFAALVGLLWTLAYVLTERRVAEALAFSDRYGLPRTMEELVGAPIDESRNAAVPLAEATAIAAEEMAKSPGFRAGGYSLSASELVEPARLYGNERYEALVRAADERAEYRTLAMADNFPTYSAYQRVMEGCRFDSAELAIARWLGLEGKRKEAVGRLVRLLRISRKWSDKEPTYWAAIIRESIENQACYYLAANLRKGSLPSYVHEAIEAELAQSLDYTKAAQRGIQAEKLVVLDFCDNYSLTPRSWVFQPLHNFDKLYALGYFHRSMENMVLRPIEIRAAQLRWEEDDQNLRKNFAHRWAHPVSAQHLPSFQNLVDDFRHPYVMARCIRILNAMTRQENLRAPLDALGLPEECLVDPYDGKRLRVKYADAGPTIYSVGRNLVDDGADYKDWRDVGVWPPVPEAKK